MCFSSNPGLTEAEIAQETKGRFMATLTPPHSTL